jgi:hypothetical protein
LSGGAAGRAAAVDCVADIGAREQRRRPIAGAIQLAVDAIEDVAELARLPRSGAHDRTVPAALPSSQCLKR